jgi:hypothetical protein
MIIELPVLPNRPGGAARHRMGFFHFSNNNLAIRKQCALDVGKYDPEMRTSEDVEICFRVAMSGHWVACREPGVVVRHRNRSTIGAMVKQLWGWGINLGRAYRKTGIHGAYLYWVSPSSQTITADAESPRFPGLVCGFITTFHLAHLFAIAGLAALVLGHPLLAAAQGIATLAFVRLRSFAGRGLGIVGALKLIVVSYLANVAFMTAAMIGGLRAGMLLIPAPIFPSPPAPTGSPRAVE